MPDLVDIFGEALFGRRLRLRVLLWVAQTSDPFNQTEAAQGVGYSAVGEVAKELERLVGLDMLRKFDRPNRVGPQRYVRLVGHPLWRAVTEVRGALDELEELGPAGPGDAEAPDGGASGVATVQDIRRNRR